MHQQEKVRNLHQLEAYQASKEFHQYIFPDTTASLPFQDHPPQAFPNHSKTELAVLINFILNAPVRGKTVICLEVFIFTF